MSSIDEIIELYKRDLDMTMIEESLRRTPEERILALEEFEKFREELKWPSILGATRLTQLLHTLVSGRVTLIVVGGVAEGVHGVLPIHPVVEVLYRRDPQNLERIVAALAPHHPYRRGAPPGLPFRLDVDTMRGALNFTLVTDLGWLDLLGEIAGGGFYEDLVAHSFEVKVLGVSCRALAPRLRNRGRTGSLARMLRKMSPVRHYAPLGLINSSEQRASEYQLWR